MGNCCESCELYNKPQKNITLLVLGLDNAGKTTMAKRLVGEPVDFVLKTLGFSLVVLRYHSYQINLYDLGGSAQIRGIWSKYFMDAHGIIYMVDSSDLNRLDETKRIFIDLLSHKNVSGKPVLLLANKQDKDNALDELEIIDQLDVERVVNRYRCLTRVEICSALTLEKNKMDIGIKNGFRWLIENIITNYQSLNERVQRDMAEFASRVQRDREAWKARVETNEAADACGDVAVENGNPFHPIDQVIKNINGRVPSKKIINKMCNGGAVRKVLIDNYVREESPSDSSIPDFTVKRKNDDNILDIPVDDSCRNRIPDFTVKTDSAKSQNLATRNVEINKRPYSKYKRKFIRFNKTAPMPIDALMEENTTSDSKPSREVSKYSIESNFGFVSNDEPEQRSRNYLMRRPATAPSKLNFSAVKVNTIWDLDISAVPNSMLSAR